MVIRHFKYKPKDVDCRFCTEFIRGRCQADKCSWVKERVEAGVLSYKNAVNEAFEEGSLLHLRIKTATDFHNKSFWKDEEHLNRFDRIQTVLGYNKTRNTDAYYAAMFLLSANEELTVRTSACFCNEQLDFSKAKLRDILPELYVLYKAAKSIYTDSSEVGVDELADPELVDAETFRLVINAMLIHRYGLSALYLKSEGEEHGCMPS